MIPSIISSVCIVTIFSLPITVGTMVSLPPTLLAQKTASKPSPVAIAATAIKSLSPPWGILTAIGSAPARPTISIAVTAAILWKKNTTGTAAKSPPPPPAIKKVSKPLPAPTVAAPKPLRWPPCPIPTITHAIFPATFAAISAAPNINTKPSGAPTNITIGTNVRSVATTVASRPMFLLSGSSTYPWENMKMASSTGIAPFAVCFWSRKPSPPPAVSTAMKS